jgi:putative DNA primase/helicase
MLDIDITQLNAQTILSDDVLTQVFDEQDAILQARYLLTLQEKAKALGVKMQFDNMVGAYKKAIREVKREQKAEVKRQQSSFDNYTQFDYPESFNELYCGNWIADHTGVRMFTMMGEMLACYHPILPVQRLINAETGREKVKIAFQKGAYWKDIIVDKGIIASANKIVSLADYGISVTSETSRALVKFLSDLENFNIDLIETKISTSKFGWIKDEFMPYGMNIEFDSESRFKDIFESVQEFGSCDKWFDMVRGLRKTGRFEINVYLAASFASVLLKPLNVLPFIVNLWGETGKGKTVALMVAASIWANPAENKYITDPVSTMVALEVRDNILNNLPMIIDDLSKTRDKYGDQFTDIIYMLCGGKGKDRSNKDLALNSATGWQNVVLTNIERPLATETMRGGAINRILDFEMGDGSIFENGNAVVKVISKNYGFAGRLFIDVIKDIGIDEITAMQQDYLAQIEALADEIGAKKEEKQIIPLSVLLTADRLATDYIFKDYIYLDLNEMIGFMKNQGDVSENERAYEFIMSEISINVNRFKPNAMGEYQGEVWGCIEKGMRNTHTEDIAIIIKNAFDKMCEKGNFSSKAFLSWAVKKDLIIQSAGKNTKNKRFGDSNPRCVWLKMRDDSDGFIDYADYDGQEKLPFN